MQYRTIFEFRLEWNHFLFWPTKNVKTSLFSITILNWTNYRRRIIHAGCFARQRETNCEPRRQECISFQTAKYCFRRVPDLYTKILWESIVQNRVNELKYLENTSFHHDSYSYIRTIAFSTQPRRRNVYRRCCSSTTISIFIFYIRTSIGYTLWCMLFFFMTTARLSQFVRTMRKKPNTKLV